MPAVRDHEPLDRIAGPRSRGPRGYRGRPVLGRRAGRLMDFTGLVVFRHRARQTRPRGARGMSPAAPPDGDRLDAGPAELGAAPETALGGRLVNLGGLVL